MNNSNLLTMEAGSETAVFFEEEYCAQHESSYFEKAQNEEAVVIKGTITVSP